MTAITGSQQREAEDRHLVAALPRAKQRGWGYWATLALGIYLTLAAVRFFGFNRHWNWPLVGEYLFGERVLHGVLNTIQLTIVACVLGVAFGVIACAARLSRFPVLRALAFCYVWVIRATPVLVLLLLIYFLGALVPEPGIGIPFGPTLFSADANDIVTRYTAAILGLSFYLGGKSAEIIRSGVLAVGAGQYEAAKALGLSPRTTYIKVVSPQAIRVLIPPMANELITMFKNTSLVSVIGYAELLTTVQSIYAVNFETVPLLAVACIWYLAITSILMLLQMWLERRYGRGFAPRRVRKARGGLA